jgi:hypothetical protein
MKRISVEAECKGTTMEELIPEMAWEVKRRDKKSRPVYKKLLKQAEALENFEGDEAQQVYEALIQAMDDMAPPYFYFGPVEGGYNYTLDRTGLEDVLKVGDHKDLPKNYRGEYIFVSDHGNMTLYYRNSKRVDREIWAIV